jgi:alkylation response protein AidB-like acyl-CoA dehydrogenase
MEVAVDAVQVHGATASSRSTRSEKLMRDAKVMQLD